MKLVFDRIMERNSTFSGSLLLQRRGLIPPFFQAIKRAAASFLVATLGMLLFVPAAFGQLSTNTSVFQYAIFYNGLLEFTTCAPLTINGRVQCNNNIYTGSGASDPLTFNGLVTCVGTISSPAWAGDSPPYGNTGTFDGSPAPGFITNAPPLMLPIGPNNLHAIIDMPTSNDWTTALGQQQLYNEANVIILVSNSMIYTNNMTSTNFNKYMSNTTVTVTLQVGQNGLIAASDNYPFTITYTNNPSYIVATNPVYSIAINLPFLTLTNTFIDNRQSNQVLVSQINVGKYSSWLTSTSTNAINQAIQDKFNNNGLYPTILYVADNRAVLSTQFTALRLTNGAALPTNGSLGFTVATPDSLYVIGTYNCPNTNYIGSSNTVAAGAVPAALMSDALTILSAQWKDTNGSFVGTVAINSTDQVNAAILTGIVPSTGSSATQYSGGVQNLPRLLENWGNATLSLNTSIANLFNSKRATNQFQFPSLYYIAPKSRFFYYDLSFLNPWMLPPGAPMLAILMITNQPQSQAVFAGTNVTFSVSAIGIQPISYQWQFDSNKISGATNTSLTITNVSLANVGTYSVIVTNISGSLTSSNALLTVTDAPPTISMQPTNQTVDVGCTTIFSVTATGSLPLSYQWCLNGTNLGGARNVSLTLTNVQLTQAGTYAVVVSNAYGSITSSNAVLMVGLPPVITTQPSSCTNVAGTTASFTVAASGTAPLSYQWNFNGTNLLNATNTTLTLTNVQLAQAGTYAVQVSNAYGSASSSNAVLTVLSPPVITQQPVSCTNVVGTTASFTVVAIGTAPLSYQWQFNGTNLLNAINATLTLPNVQFSQVGPYAVVVTNVYGLVTSSNAVLSVVSAPPCTPAPTNIVSWWEAEGNALDSIGGNNGTLTNGAGFGPGVVGQAFSFNASSNSCVVVPDSPTLRLTNALTIECWAQRLNTSEVHVLVEKGGDWTGGQTDFEMSMNDTYSGGQFAFAFAEGWRGCAVTPDTAWHHYAAVAVNGQSNPILYIDGVPQTITSRDGPATINMTASTRPLHIGAQVDPQTGWNYYSSTMVDELSLYQRALSANEIQAIYNAGSSGKCPLPPGILIQPTNQTVIAGSNTTFNVTANGTPLLNYQWSFNGTNLDGATNTSLMLTNIQVAQGGDYAVAVSNAYGSITSSNAVLTVVTLSPTILIQPTNQTVVAGSNTTFNVTVGGTPPFDYQWSFNGTNLDGATNTSLTLTNVQLAQAGNYLVQITNAFGSVMSSNAVLTVIALPPGILTQPTNETALVGSTAIFSVTATGSLPLSYQWQFNGTDIAGATNLSLTLDNAQTLNDGSYQMIVTNAYGSITSSIATLTVISSLVVAWGDNDNGQTNVPPGLTAVVAIAGGGYHNLALQANGTVVAWGNNYFGQTDVPAGLTNVVAIAAGGSHSLALQANDTVVAWGDNEYGQTNVPAGLTNVEAIAGGYGHSLALQANGIVVAWGANYEGQINVPAGLTNVEAIAAGYAHSLALQTNGTVVAWGYNAYGQTTVPASLTNVVAIAAGGDHSLALQANGTVVAWGDNSLGQTNVPAGLTNVVAIAAGGYHSLVLQANGTVVAWGWNEDGQTNVPSGLTNVVAIAGGFDDSLALENDGSPVISGQPANQATLNGATVLFSVTALGQPPLSYQWQENGINLTDGGNVSGTATSTLTLTNVQTSDAGAYSVVVTNAFGSITSSNAVLTVLSPPVITQQPACCTNIVGSKAAFSVTAYGTPLLSYQWSFNGTNLDGATNTSLTLANVTADQAGAYSVTITNMAGSVTSSNAVLSVYPTAAPTLNSPSVFGSNQFQTGVAGVPGFNYAVQVSTNLYDWDWLITNASPFSFVDTNSTSFPQRFYRAIYLP
jgi:alpha-tubulin suppressor-like RCC1 family protein